jgi:Flp pilus assembly protein TadG
MNIHSFARDRSGATAVEFAFTAPAFLALVGGIIEIGLLLFTQVALQHGVEAGARCASVDSHLCATVSDVKTYAASQSLGLSVPTSTFTVATVNCGIQVSASSPFSFIFSFAGRPSLTLTAASCYPK